MKGKAGYWIDMIQPATTADEFSNLKALESQNEFTFLEPPVNDTIHSNPAPGYQPLEYITGFRGSNDAKKYKNKMKVGFTRPSIFGHCSQDYTLKFMENLDSEECVISKKTMNADICNSLSFANLSSFTVDSGDGQLISPTPGNALKFSLDTYKQISLTSNQF